MFYSCISKFLFYLIHSFECFFLVKLLSCIKYIHDDMQGVCMVCGVGLKV